MVYGLLFSFYNKRPFGNIEISIKIAWSFQQTYCLAYYHMVNVVSKSQMDIIYKAIIYLIDYTSVVIFGHIIILNKKEKRCFITHIGCLSRNYLFKYFSSFSYFEFYIQQYY